MFNFVILCLVICVYCVNGIQNGATSSTSLTGMSSSGGGTGGNKELKSEETRSDRDVAPEYYRGPGSSSYDRDVQRDRDGRYGSLLNRPTSSSSLDRYGGGNNNDFITSPGIGLTSSGRDRYPSITTASTSIYNRDRLSSGSNNYYPSMGNANILNGGRYGIGSSNSGSGASGYGNNVNYGYAQGGTYDLNRIPTSPYPPTNYDSYNYYNQYPGYEIHETTGYDNGYGGYGGGYGGGNGQHLSKKVLLPLAGAALIGVAAALAANPMLLHFGAGRKRRDVTNVSGDTKVEEIGNSLAYRGYQN